MLNTALTFTKKSQKRHHAKLWKPFVKKVISYLACREEATVFLCFGNKAWDFLGAHVQNTLIDQDLVVRRKHPSKKHLFLEVQEEPNIFEDANAKLSAAGRNNINFLGPP